MNVTSLLRRSALHHHDRVAAIAGDRRLTYAEAWDRGVRLANGLRAAGAEPGDRVAFLEGNTVEAFDTFLGAAIAGVVRVPLYARNRRRSHIQMLANTGATILVVDEKFVAEVEGFVDEVLSLEKLIVRGEDYESWLAAQSPEDPLVPARGDDLLVIRHTGGTTSDPLAAPITHDQWISTVNDYFYHQATPLSADVCLHIGPISHASGYWFVPMWMAGAAQVAAENLSTTELIEVIESHGITHMFLPPVLLTAICQEAGVEDRDFSSLKSLVIGSQPTSEATLRRGHEVFGHVLYQLYGATETAIIGAVGPDEWFAHVPGSEPLRSAGRLFPWAEVEIRDADGNVLPPGSAGLIWTRTRGQIDGYMNAPEQTAQRFRDGWVHIGDIGMIDANGYLYLIDRANDMIISGGYNIYPSELENVIAMLPGVLEAAVFGVPSDKWGETPVAVVCTRPDANLTAQDVIEHVSRELGSYRKPSRVVLQTERLPRSPVGKLLRRALRDPYWEGEDRRIAGA